MSPCRVRQPSKSYVLFKERLGQDDPLKDSIAMLCLPLGYGNPGEGYRTNQNEWLGMVI